MASRTNSLHQKLAVDLRKNIERDLVLLEAWNREYPGSAADYCETLGIGG